MKLQLIRNATLLLDYAGSRLLIDPMLGDKHIFRSFAGISENPTVGMPIPAEDVLLNIDGVLVSHLHPDHFDEVAQQLIPKETAILAEPNTVSTLKDKMGFSSVQSVDQTLQWRGLEIEPTPGEHGYGDWLKRMGPVSGFILRAEGEPTVYWAGDTVLCPAVEQVLADHQPDIVITHSGGAQFGGPEGLILMDAEQTLKVAELVPNAKIIATHLESLDHCTVTRDGLRQAAEGASVSERIIIPSDGELLEDIV